VVINPGFDATPAGGPPSFPSPGAPSGTAEGCYGPDSASPPFRSEGTFPVLSKLETSGVALSVDWRISETVNITSITGFRDMTMQSARDGDNTPANIFATVDDYDHQQFSQELQLHYRSDNQRFQSLLGLFYFDEEGFNLVDVIVPSGALRSGGFYDNQSFAAFSHASYELSDATSVSLGLRFTQDIKGYLPDQYALGDASMGGVPGFFDPTWPLLAGSYLAPTGPLPAGTRILDFRRSEERFDHTDYSFDLKQLLSENMTAYLSYSTAYKSGGFDQRFVGPTPDRAPSSYSPETVDSVELGIKTRWLNGALQLNAAIFDARYDDLQVIVRESFNPLTFNAGQASIRGGELELGWLIDENWSLDLGLGWLDTRYRQLTQSAQDSGVALSNSLVNAPPLNSSVGVTYLQDLGSYGSLQGRVDWIWKDEQFNDAINSEQIRQAPYHQLNASLGFETPNSGWQLTLAARNLLNETFLVGGNSAFDTAASYVERVYARPREIYLSARLAF
ncbi:MAG: TonB-dependent receptor, partial [Congregibacter sp.]|nr:TonB-dependent receptor [Congregibacter sp.]